MTPSVVGQKIIGGNPATNNRRRLEKLRNMYDPTIENPSPFITLAMRENFHDDGLIQPLDDDDFYYQDLELQNKKAQEKAAAEGEQKMALKVEVDMGA